MRASLHQLSDGASVARAFDDEIGDERDGLRMVELDAPLEPASRHHCGHGDQELVLFPRRQIYGASSLLIDFSGPANSAPSQGHSRGLRPPSAIMDATRPMRNWSNDAARRRATIRRSKALAALSTSEPAVSSAARRSGRRASILGPEATIVDRARAPAPTALRSRVAPAWSILVSSANTSRPSRRTRHESQHSRRFGSRPSRGARTLASPQEGPRPRRTSRPRAAARGARRQTTASPEAARRAAPGSSVSRVAMEAARSSLR